MDAPVRVLKLRREDEAFEDWAVTPALASVIGFASAANRATKKPEDFDVTFTTLLYGFLRATDKCSRFVQERASQGALDLTALLARKDLSAEKLGTLDDASATRDEFVYTVSGKNLLTNALRYRFDRPTPDASGPLDVRQLLGAFIYEPAGHSQDLQSVGFSRVDWSKAFRRWIEIEYPGETRDWQALENDTFKAVDAPAQQTAAAAPVSSRSDRVVFDNDLVIEKIALTHDRLNMRPEVERLARLLAAKRIRPPIALGLFGRWGSGKSFFMGMLRTRVDELAKADTSGEYAANAVQITFNAWHYQDSSLWASLALRIFEVIAQYLGGNKPDEAAKKRQELHSKLDSSVKLRKDAESRRDAAAARRSEAAAKLEKAQQRRVASQSKLSAARLKRVWEALATDQTFDRQISALRKDVAALGLKDAADGIDDITRMQSELHALDGSGRALVTALGASFRDVKASFVSCLFVAAVIAAVVLLHKAQPRYQWVPSSTTVYQLLTVGGAALAWSTRKLNQLSSAARSADALRQKVAGAWADNPPSDEEQALAREVEGIDATIQKMNNEIAAAEQRTAEAEAEIQRINAGGLVYDFLTERRASNAYLAHVGLISTIRQDFERLGTLLADLKTKGTRPIDRIVLYIDDLDRCEPEKVVEVLQAVHLLLAFDIFNVVVGVDARWLERALNEMYARTGGQAGQPAGPAARVVTASPFRAQNYLEKIFQVSFSLGAMNPTTFGQLVGELLPTRSEREAELKRKASEKKTNEKGTPSRGGEKKDGGIGKDADHHPLGSAAAAREHDAGTIDLKEELGTLFFEDFEEHFIQELYPFIETPRLAKRMVNVYRLLRVTASQEDFDAFTSGPSTGTYQAALLLLAINIGYPVVGRKLLSELSNGASATSLVDLYGRMAPEPAIAPDSTDPDGVAFELVRKKLGAMSNVLGGLEAYKHWAPRVGRYSFDWNHPVAD